MNTRKMIVSGLVLVSLALTVLIASRAAALPQPAHPAVSHYNQIFYSPNVESIVNRGHTVQVANQEFYSPGIESIVKRGRIVQVTNQVFYSPSIEGFVNPSHELQVTNQVFYSPAIESFVH